MIFMLYDFNQNWTKEELIKEYNRVAHKITDLVAKNDRDSDWMLTNLYQMLGELEVVGNGTRSIPKK